MDKAAAIAEAKRLLGVTAAQLTEADWEAAAAQSITVDTEAPEVVDMSVRESEGRYYATVTVKDNQYVAAVVLTDS